MECQMPIWAFEILISGGMPVPIMHSKSECSSVMHNAHISIQNLKIPEECPMSIWASKSECSIGMSDASMSIQNLKIPMKYSS